MLSKLEQAITLNRECGSVIDQVRIDGERYTLRIFCSSDDRTEARDSKGVLLVTFNSRCGIVIDGKQVGRIGTVLPHDSTSNKDEVWCYSLYDDGSHEDVFVETPHLLRNWRGIYQCELEVVKALVAKQKEQNNDSATKA